MGPLGPMVRGRALVPVVLGRGCLLLPNGFGCQLQSHLFIPMVPTGRMGILRLGEVPLPWDHGTAGWLVRPEGEDGRPASGHDSQNQVSPCGGPQKNDNPCHLTTWGFRCYGQRMSSERSLFIVGPNLSHRSSHHGSAECKLPSTSEGTGSFLGIVPQAEDPELR